jgi:DNA-directed RNA polymerase specialized sigma24 family protein
MERLADGDRSAFEPVYAALWPQLRAFAAQVLGPHDGDDAAQAALLKLFARASEFDPSRDALAWALGIAAFECRTLLKKRARRREEPAADDAAAIADRWGGSPEEALIDRDLCAAAGEVLGLLRPIDRETILSLENGQRAVAGATFRKRLERALSRFRAVWRTRHGDD